ncbi:hypothetical protein Tco_0328559 [Tanacetum coccineum]
MANLNSRSKTFCLLPISFEVIEGKIDSRTSEINEDLSRYVLQIQEEMEFVERTLKGISNPMNSFVLKAEKEQDIRLLELLKKSTDFDRLGEGLSYTHLVEESLNISSEYVNIQKATITLWNEVENNCKWLKNSLSNNDFEGKTATKILKWFADKAEEIVIEISKSSNGIMVDNNIPKELIDANSM